MSSNVQSPPPPPPIEPSWRTLNGDDFAYRGTVGERLSLANSTNVLGNYHHAAACQKLPQNEPPHNGEDLAPPQESHENLKIAQNIVGSSSAATQTSDIVDWQHATGVLQSHVADLINWDSDSDTNGNIHVLSSHDLMDSDAINVGDHVAGSGSDGDGEEEAEVANKNVDSDADDDEQHEAEDGDEEDIAKWQALLDENWDFSNEEQSISALEELLRNAEMAGDNENLENESFIDEDIDDGDDDDENDDADDEGSFDSVDAITRCQTTTDDSVELLPHQEHEHLEIGNQSETEEANVEEPAMKWESLSADVAEAASNNVVAASSENWHLSNGSERNRAFDELIARTRNSLPPNFFTDPNVTLPPPPPPPPLPSLAELLAGSSSSTTTTNAQSSSGPSVSGINMGNETARAAAINWESDGERPGTSQMLRAGNQNSSNMHDSSDLTALYNELAAVAEWQHESNDEDDWDMMAANASAATRHVAGGMSSSTFEELLRSSHNNLPPHFFSETHVAPSYAAAMGMQNNRITLANEQAYDEYAEFNFEDFYNESDLETDTQGHVFVKSEPINVEYKDGMTIEEMGMLMERAAKQNRRKQREAKAKTARTKLNRLI